MASNPMAIAGTASMGLERRGDGLMDALLLINSYASLDRARARFKCGGPLGGEISAP
jgi:hypothetical protein